MSDGDISVTDFSRWLERYQLGRYHTAMVQQDIDLTTVRDLNDEDFRELGVSIGHRKILRRAIEELRPQDGDDETSEAAHRRQVTIMFCDLAGSTEIARRYDAEDYAAILRRYHDRCKTIIRVWGGSSLGTQGDGVVACFGYPRALENDAERCVRAALEISHAVRTMQFDDDLVLQSRIGVATGRVFVGDLAQHSSAIVGDTLNFAARLQDLAAANTVVVERGTKRIVEKIARLERIGERELKGFSDPVEVWTVTGVLDAADRQEVDGTEVSSRLVGRSQERELLEGLWADAKEGNGRVAVISGEAGIGKSHLLDALQDLVRQDDHVRIRYFCAPFYENSAMYPVIAQLSRAAEIRDSDDTKTKIEKLRRLFPGKDETAVSLVADLLSIDRSGSLAKLDMTAAQQKLETFAALTAQLLRQSEQSPVLILAEDAHWSDPTSLEFLSMVAANAVPGNRILLVVTHRASMQLTWDIMEHAEYLRLDRLSPEDSKRIVEQVMGPGKCPPALMHDIVENADGIPLFVEELARSVAEQKQTTSLGPINLPSTLEASLMARLDRLKSGKSVVQTAAVFGRRFVVPLLKPIVQMEDGQFEQAMREPIDAKIIAPLQGGVEDTMLFRHALIQQAAYEGLLLAQRRELHGRIAELLLEHQPGIVETEPETLARHYSGAEQFDKAVEYLIAAGKRATSRAAEAEAANHYLAALDRLEKLPESRERDSQEVLLRALLGGALMATKGFAAPDVYDAFARARELCISLGDNPMYCSCLYGLFTVNASRSNKEEAIALADEMLATFAESPVVSWAIAAHFAAGVTAFFQGELENAQTHLDRVVELYADDQHQTLIEQFGDDLAEFSMCYLQWLHLQKGEIDLSASYLKRAEEMADQLNNKSAQTRSISFRMGRLQELGDLEAVNEIAPQVIDISTSQGYPYWATAGRIGYGWALSCAGQAEGIDMIEAGLGFFDLIGQKTPQTYWRTYLVSALISVNRKDDAIAAADAAIDQAKNGLDTFYRSALCRLKGEACLLSPSDPAHAEQCFQEGLAFAKAAGMNLHRLQCCVSIAELLTSQGRGSEAADELTAAIEAISSEETFPTLAKAKALLSSRTD